VDHRVEPPSWLPQGAAPKAADPAEADEAPASDDAHALQDDSAEADSTAEEFSNGNGHEGPYTYLRDDSHIYNQDSAYAGGQESPYAGRAPFEEPTRPPFDELPGASFDQPAAPPPGDELAGSTFGSGVTVGRPESGYSSAADAGGFGGSAGSTDVPDGGFGGSAPGGPPDGGFGGSAPGGPPDGGFGGGFTGSGFTGSAFTGSAFTGSPAGADLHDGGFTGGAAEPGSLAGSGPAGGDPYTAHYAPGYSESPAPTVATGPETVSPSAQRTGTYAYPPPPQSAPVSPPPPAKGRQSASSARRANLIVARLEPWSVMKFSFLISLVAWIVLFVAVALLYYALSSLGVFASLQKTLASVTSSQGSAGVDLSKWTSGTRVMGYTMLLGAVDVVLITALSTLGAVVYNLVTHLGGGIEITLKETE
jgi:Transmembrane domain of unknown function (DUF3566)